MAQFSAGSSKPMDQVEISWLAGIIDGEGTFSFQERESDGCKFVRISVESTDLDTLEQCLSFSGMGNITGPRLRKENNRKPIWVWRVSKRKDVFRLFLAIAPLLSNRRKEKILEIANKIFPK